eukprot:scaffold27345_cov20-Prasinocladus_malaysianus.AAC.2
MACLICAFALWLMAATMQGDEQEGQDGDDEFEVVEEIEEAIELLLQGLRAKDTIVRWSSAKGLGRVLGRLPKVAANLSSIERAATFHLISQTDFQEPIYGLITLQTFSSHKM